MMKKVLLIGGAGFIGLRIARHLFEHREGYDITVLDNFFRGKIDEELKELQKRYSLKIIEGDCTVFSTFDDLDSDYDHVYMLASIVGVEYTARIPHEIIRINTLLILNTLEWLKKTSCKKVLFTSTSECYAGTIEAFDYITPTPEDVPLCIAEIGNPRFTYAVTKMLGESGFLNYAKSFGFECVIVRYHNIYGERMGFKHVIPQVTQRFLNGEDPFRIYGFDQTRAFCYVEDAVAGTIMCMEEENTNAEIFHIGMEEEITIEELVRFIGKTLDYQGEYIMESAPKGSVSRRCPDISKAKAMLGYQPVTGYRQGVLKTVNWYKQYLGSGRAVYE